MHYFFYLSLAFLLCLAAVVTAYLYFESHPMNSVIKLIDSKLSLEDQYRAGLDESSRVVRDLQGQVQAYKTSLAGMRTELLAVQATHKLNSNHVDLLSSWTLGLGAAVFFLLALLALVLRYTFRIETLLDALSLVYRNKAAAQRASFESTLALLLAQARGTLDNLALLQKKLDSIRETVLNSHLVHVQWLEERNSKIAELNLLLQQAHREMGERKLAITAACIKAKEDSQKIILTGILNTFKSIRKQLVAIEKNFRKTFLGPAGTQLKFKALERYSLYSTLHSLKTGFASFNLGIKEVSSVSLAMLAYYNLDLLQALTDCAPDLLGRLGPFPQPPMFSTHSSYSAFLNTVLPEHPLPSTLWFENSLEESYQLAVSHADGRFAPNLSESLRSPGTSSNLGSLRGSITGSQE